MEISMAQVQQLLAEKDLEILRLRSQIEKYEQSVSEQE